MRPSPRVLIALAVAAPAFATDGVLEINQTCAVNTGCFADDAPGFPVTIGANGSYRLTSNLDLRTAPTPQNVTGIQITATGVEIDLNGFAILGPTACTGTPPTTDLTCTPVGTGFGIAGSEITSVHGGSINGTGSVGILCGAGCFVEHVRIENTGSHGIQVGAGSVVTANITRRNALSGIQSIQGATLRGNSSFENGQDGILASDAATVEGNTCSKNRRDGILAGAGSSVAGNTARQNFGDGIEALDGSLVADNAMVSNNGYGLNASNGGSVAITTVAYGGNMIRLNALGSVHGGTQLGTNFCDTDTVCP